VHDLPILNERGSFQVNDPQHYIFSLHPLLIQEYRNGCWHAGFQSLTVIPIRDHGRALGLIHVADERPGQVPGEAVTTLEAAADRIGGYIRLYEQIELMK
jgi:GAF domain-containing protein